MPATEDTPLKGKAVSLDPVSNASCCLRLLMPGGEQLC